MLPTIWCYAAVILTFSNVYDDTILVPETQEISIEEILTPAVNMGDTLGSYCT